MAAIASINAAQLGAFAAAISTLSADDTITIDAGKKQLLVFTNTTGGALTATIDGDGGTTVNFPGAPGISVAAGYAVAVPAGESRAVVLSTISAYTKGVVHITGAATLKAQLFNL
jgi:hypothetical protein